jgi:hypothetical protein
MSTLREAAQEFVADYDCGGCGHFAAYAENFRKLLAQQEQEQEPFGYIWPTGRHPEFRYTKQMRDGVAGMPLYTHPPRREWQGLRNKEIVQIVTDNLTGGDWVDVARAIEAALKEKNHE